jgi:hypothetical protein
MEIKLRTRSYIAELTVESGNAKITEDLAQMNDVSNAYIPDEEIEKLLTVAREMHLFNKGTDIDFVKMVYEAFLTDGERSEFLDTITNL